MIFGLLVIPFGFPGAAIILLCVLVYALTMGFASIGVPLFVVLCVMTIIAETADNWLSAIGTRRYGGSTASIWLSFFGGLVGAAILGGPLVFILGPLGPVAGGFAGAFVAVVLYEYHRHGNVHEAVRAGWGTMLGRTAGMLLKIVIAAAMITAVAIALFS
jgi:uncharacterized protein YqgC (DUF456 family)